MYLNVKDLKEFLSTSKSVRTNGILPILSYVFFDGERLIKSNNETFYSMDMPSKNGFPVLLDEQKLSSFISTYNIGNAESIMVSATEKTVTLSLPDGSKPLSFGRMDHTKFPKFPETDGEYSVLDSAVLQMVFVARNIIAPAQDILTNYNFIHLAEGGIYASNGLNFFHYETVHNAGNVLLSKEAAGIIGGKPEALVLEAGNYTFFTTENESFAFIKPEQKTPVAAFRGAIQAANKDEWCEINKADIIAFCELVSQVCPSLQTANPVTFPDCTLTVKGKEIILTLKDSVYAVDVQHEYESRGKYEIPAFNFNPKLFLSYFKSLPFDTLRFSPFARPGFLSLWTVEDESFTGILSQLQTV